MFADIKIKLLIFFSNATEAEWKLQSVFDSRLLRDAKIIVSKYFES